MRTTGEGHPPKSPVMKETNLFISVNEFYTLLGFVDCDSTNEGITLNAGEEHCKLTIRNLESILGYLPIGINRLSDDFNNQIANTFWATLTN